MTAFSQDPVTPEATPPAATPPAAAPATSTDIEKLAKRLEDKDTFIETLKNERAADRVAQAAMQQKIDLLMAAQEALRAEPPATPAPQSPTAVTISAEDLRKAGFVTKEDLEAEARATTQRANFKHALELGRKQFGEKLDEIVEAKCKTMGVSVDWAKAQAATAPAVFLELFGINSKVPAPTQPSTPDTRTSIFENTTNNGERKSVMFGATTKDMMNAWRGAATRTAG